MVIVPWCHCCTTGHGTLRDDHPCGRRVANRSDPRCVRGAGRSMRGCEMMTRFPAPLRRLLLTLLGGALACLCWLIVASPPHRSPPRPPTPSTLTTDTGAGCGHPRRPPLRHQQRQPRQRQRHDHDHHHRHDQPHSALPAPDEERDDHGADERRGDHHRRRLHRQRQRRLPVGRGDVFTVNSGVTANLSNLTIQHGNGGGAAAASSTRWHADGDEQHPRRQQSSGERRRHLQQRRHALRDEQHPLRQHAPAFGGGIYNFGRHGDA